MRYILNGGQELVDEVDRGGGRLDSEGYGVLSEVIAREEVMWALHKLKGKEATGKDGLTAEMIGREELVDLL